MIARSSPSDERRRMYVPLRFDPQRAAWVPPAGADTFCDREIDAARWCANDLARCWAGLYRVAQQLRIYCDHPSVDHFSGDGIDGPTIREVAHLLARKADIADELISHLLVCPTADDVIQIGEQRYRVDPEAGLIAPADDGEEGTDDGEDNAERDRRRSPGQRTSKTSRRRKRNQNRNPRSNPR